MKRAFRARKVTGTFEKRAHDHIKNIFVKKQMAFCELRLLKRSKNTFSVLHLSTHAAEFLKRSLFTLHPDSYPVTMYDSGIKGEEIGFY